MFDLLKKRIANIVKSVSEGITESIPKKIIEKKISEKDLKQVLDDLEIGLLEADVAVEVIDKIKEGLKKNLIGKTVKRGKVKEIVSRTIRNSLLEILDLPEIDLKKIIKENKPCLLVFFGFNGSGKTTSIAKIGYYLRNGGYSCIFSAGDTFRAASIEQLEEHGKKLGIKIIKHKYGADAAAVIYDGVEHAKTKGIDVVLADTAGRTHTDRNLADELKKICRVNKPHLKILVVDSLTGNDVVNQAKMFDEMIGVDAIILTKIDVNKKGGAVLSICKILGKPIVGLGTGQKYIDLIPFDRNEFIDNLLK